MAPSGVDGDKGAECEAKCLLRLVDLTSAMASETETLACDNEHAGRQTKSDIEMMVRECETATVNVCKFRVAIFKSSDGGWC